MKNWEVKKLGVVCSFFNGQAHEKVIDENGKYKLINSKFVSSEGEKFKRTNIALSPLFVNDIVMVMSDVPNGKTLAKCFVVDKEDTYTLNQRICVIRSKNFDTRFLYYQLNRNKYLLSFDNGENQSNLRKDDILNCELFVPPLKEQQQIVSILDEAFAAIAKAKANAEQNLKNAKELFESYLQELFENGDWEEKKLSDLSNTGAGGTPLKSHKDYYQGGNVPWLRSGEVSKKDIVECELFITEKGLKNSSARLFPEDTVLIAMYGATAGQVGILRFECTTNQAVCGILPNKNIIPEFLYYKFMAGKQALVDQAVGGAQPNISQIKIKNTLVPFISLNEQQTIVKKLDALSAETKKLEAIYQKKIKDLEELKKSVLQKAFSGEL
jgi:type I restriction enzyme S subunit